MPRSSSSLCLCWVLIDALLLADAPLLVGALLPVVHHLLHACSSRNTAAQQLTVLSCRLPVHTKQALCVHWAMLRTILDLASDALSLG
jgi:hypothetical protein